MLDLNQAHFSMFPSGSTVTTPITTSKIWLGWLRKRWEKLLNLQRKRAKPGSNCKCLYLMIKQNSKHTSSTQMPTFHSAIRVYMKEMIALISSAETLCRQRIFIKIFGINKSFMRWLPARTALTISVKVTSLTLTIGLHLTLTKIQKCSRIVSICSVRFSSSWDQRPRLSDLSARRKLRTTSRS